MQKIFIVGNITKDLTITKTANGKSKLDFSVATNKYTKEKQYTEFWNCVAWEKTAEFIAKYFEKGSKIALDLEKSTQPYTNKAGEEKTYTCFIVREVDFCGGAKKEQTQQEETEIMADDMDEDINIEDIPF